MLKRLWDMDASSLEGLKPSFIALIIANLIPLFGVLFLHWEVFPLLLLFWLENLIIGVFNALKMVFCSARDAARSPGKLFAIPFFCVHYGIFTLVHGVFILFLFGGSSFGVSEATDIRSILSTISELQLWWGVLGLFISHGISFAVNYIGRGEFRQVDLKQLMRQPYARVALLHVTILLGGFLLVTIHSPLPGLILLVLVKTALDMRSHIGEHSAYRRDSSDKMEM
jgi:hypothetical protein